MNSGQFKKGSTPHNKGDHTFRSSPDTEFKSGDNHTGEKHPSWQGGVQHNANDCAYLWDGNNKRIRRPRRIYEINHGEIPKGFIIIHSDGDKNNDDPDNLEAISRKELLNRNRRS